MIDHVTIRVRDRAASERFYDTVLGELGLTRTSGEYPEWGDFSVTDGPPFTRGLHVAFSAPSPDLVRAPLRDPDGNTVEAVRDERAGQFEQLRIGVRDLAAARRFYELIAPYSGFELEDERDGVARFRGPDASLSLVSGEPTENVHLAFGARENEVVEAFHRAAVAAGYRDNGPPGERSYHAGYYGAFVLDPDGNNVEVVCHNR